MRAGPPAAVAVGRALLGQDMDPRLSEDCGSGSEGREMVSRKGGGLRKGMVVLPGAS